MSETPSSPDDEQRETSDLEELNDDGAGGTIGKKDTFEPEETELPDADRPDPGRE